jgi:hypothetical protein
MYENGFSKCRFFNRGKHPSFMNLFIPHLFKDKLAKIDGEYVPYIINLRMEIPKDDISKYTNFTISNKNQ